MDRVAKALKMADGQPEYNMKVLMRELGPPMIVPEGNKYYVFVYEAKTPNLLYDRNPFIICTGIYKWGFTGFNYHWEDYRRYSWLEVVSNVFEIKEEEVESMKNYPNKRIKSS